MTRAFSILLFLTVFASGVAPACSVETPPPQNIGPIGKGECHPGERLLEDGRCQPPGLPLDMPCPPGETPLDGGGCQAAGVPPKECGDGFKSDGQGGCLPILPAEPCNKGLMAVPGDTTCHEISPCGASLWGDIPVEPTTQFVDGSYAGVDSNGSQTKPWTTVQEGIDAAEKGAIVAIAAGTYSENLTLSFKRKRLWGRCPSMVTLQGVDPKSPTLRVYVPDAEVRGVAITGESVGVSTYNAEPVLLENVWIHDTHAYGIEADAPSTVTLSNSLIENVGAVGVATYGGAVTLERSAIRHVLAGRANVGVSIYGEIGPSGGRAAITVRASVIEESHRNAVGTTNTDLSLERVAIRGVPASADPTIVRHGVIASKGSVSSIVQTTIEGAQAPLVIETSTGVVDHVTVHEAPSPPIGHPWIAGILVQADILAGDTATATVRHSAVFRQPQFGISVLGATATIESTLATGNAKDLGHHAAMDAERSQVTIKHSALVDNTHFGLSVEGSNVALLSSVIRGVTATTDGGECVAVRDLLGPGPLKEPSVFTMRSSIVENCVQVGVIATDSQLFIETSLLRSVKHDADGLFGDVVAIVTNDPETPASSIVGTRIEAAERAGVSSFGAALDIGFSSVGCGLFDLVGEDSPETSFSYKKVGDNVCGCPTPAELCQVASPGLAPPEIE